MSKLSQLHAELTSQAAELGFESIEQAESNGYTVKYDLNGGVSLEPDVDKAYSELRKEIEAKREAKQIEMVYEALCNAKETIALIYKDENEALSHPDKDIKDEKIQAYYYQINDMCVELSERKVMLWQKED